MDFLLGWFPFLAQEGVVIVIDHEKGSISGKLTLRLIFDLLECS